MSPSATAVNGDTPANDNERNSGEEEIENEEEEEVIVGKFRR